MTQTTDDDVERLRIVVEKQNDQIEKLTTALTSMQTKQADSKLSNTLKSTRGFWKSNRGLFARKSNSSKQHPSLPERAIKYFTEMPSAILVITFSLLLIGAAFQIGIGNQLFANRLLEVSYYVIGVGIIIHFVEAIARS